jgi:hypothetical protein
MNNDKLCEWLRNNSSGTYRPSAEAADLIEALLAQVEELVSEIRKQDEYHKSFYGHASGMMASLLEVANKSPQQSLDSLKSRIEEEVVSKITHEVQVMETVDVNSDEYERGYSECRDHVLNILEPWPTKYQTTELLEK